MTDHGDSVATCANCGWRFYSDGVGELLPFCGLCIAREFRPDAPASTDD
jgi:hypothetical protein